MNPLLAVVGVIAFMGAIVHVMTKDRRVEIWTVTVEGHGLKLITLYAESELEAQAFAGALRARGYNVVTIDKAMGYMSWVQKSREQLEA